MAWPARERPAAVVDGGVHIVLLGGGRPDGGIICVSCLTAAHLYCVHVFAGCLQGVVKKEKEERSEGRKGRNEWEGKMVSSC